MSEQVNGFTVTLLSDELSLPENTIVLAPSLEIPVLGMCFPSSTTDLRKTMETEFGVNVVLYEGASTVEQRSFDVLLPVICMAVDVLVAIGSSMIADSILDFIRSRVRRDSRDSARVRLKIILQEPNGKGKSVEYDGPIEGIEKLAEVLEEVKR